MITQLPPLELLAENFSAPLPLPPVTVKVIFALTAASEAPPVIVISPWPAAVKDNDTAGALTGP